MNKTNAFLPSHEIAASLAVKYDVHAVELASIQLSTDILTVCDTVSYPYRRGKKRAYKVAVDNIQHLLPFSRYSEPGESLAVKEDTSISAGHYIM